MSSGSEGGAEVVEKWCICCSFLIGFGIVYCSSWGSEGGAEVVHLLQFSNRFWHRLLYLLGFGRRCGSGAKVVDLEQVSFWLC